MSNVISIIIRMHACTPIVQSWVGDLVGLRFIRRFLPSKMWCVDNHWQQRFYQSSDRFTNAAMTITIFDNDNICISVHLSQGMIINYVHVHYANFALIILINLTNFNNILTSRLLNSLCISNIIGIFLKLFGIYSFRSRSNALHLNI